MNPIIFPLEQGMADDDVRNLQTVLQILMDRRAILAREEGMRDELSQVLRRERAESVYGDVTMRLVGTFQEEYRDIYGLDTSGMVDEATAAALNDLLKGWGLLDQIPVPIPTPVPTSRIVSGRVVREDNVPAQGVTVRAFHQAGETDIRLGEDTTDAEGRYTVRYEPLPGIDSINLRLVAIDEKGKSLSSTDVIQNAGALQILDLMVPIASPTSTGRIEGRIVLANGQPAESLTLRLYQRTFGGGLSLVSEANTVTGGQYAFQYNSGQAMSLEVRALNDAGEEIALSKPINDLANKPDAVLNLLAPMSLRAIAPEYSRLSEDLTPHVGEITNLAQAQENAERQDLTVLNRLSGWDARLIALAATSQRLCSDPDVQMPAPVVYGLLRAGLPYDKQLLAQIEPDTAEKALKSMNEAGIVSLSDDQIGSAKKSFAAFRDRARLNVPVPGSRSTYEGLLKASGLPDDALEKFTPVYLNHEGDGAQLWQAARQVGLSEAQIGTLQLQGKMAFLTGNSEAMTTHLMSKGIANPVQLVEQDLYRAESWIRELFEKAGIPLDHRESLTDDEKRQIADLIPAAYAAATIEESLSAYSEDMARKMRVSYPTQVLGHILENDDRFKLPEAHAETVTLLKTATEQGFRLGETPVKTFLQQQQQPAMRAAGLPDVSKNAQDMLETLTRLYQITPDNESMPVLLQMNITSSQDMLNYREDEFAHLFGGMYEKVHGHKPPADLAVLISRKAEQVNSITYNLFTIAKKMETEPAVAGMSAPIAVRDRVRNTLLKQFPTMESLFGSMDFCECEHCRSVLSPAAYFVDLMQFVDPEPGVWANFLGTWDKTHDDEYPYRHRDDPAKALTPYEALMERRPDLPHIPLTCENTQTALPYIDLVNEILEYYVAHGTLTEEAAHDTGDATTAELLAEPQNVIHEAYETLRQAHYPLMLPFDVWMETARQFCNYFEMPLDRVLDAFRPTDLLSAPTQDFDRASAFIESLEISPAEWSLFTDPKPLENDKWHDLYGFPIDVILDNPTNADPATLSITNTAAAKLRTGDPVRYFDVSANAYSADQLKIQAIGVPGSGGGGRTTITLDGVWAIPPDANDRLLVVVLDILKSAKALARSLGVTYKQIDEIVQTGFVNPELGKAALLYKLGVSVQEARLYQDFKAFYEANRDLIGKERSELPAADQVRYDNLNVTVAGTQRKGWDIVNDVAAFEKELSTLATAFNVDLNSLQQSLAALPLDKILVLADADTSCNFDETTVQYADAVMAADPIVFLRINLFVRIWRKLGWSIEETDRALSTFTPQSARFDADPAHLAAQPLKTALITLSHLKALDQKVKVGKDNRLKLMTLWSDIPITGKKPLYAQLFLTRSVLKSGQVEIIVNDRSHRLSAFDDALGDYLSPTQLSRIAEQVKYEVRLSGVKDADKIDDAPFIGEARFGLSYDALAEVQSLTYIGVLMDDEKARLAAIAPSQNLTHLLEAVQAKAKSFTRIKGHILTLQGALGLTADDIAHILKDKGLDIETEPLSLQTVSLLYKYSLLAKGLKLSVSDLIVLKTLSGLDPFKTLFADPITTIEEDYPFSQTLAFIDIVDEVKQSGLTVEDLDYLLRHNIDVKGKYRPNAESTQTLLKTLADGIRAIRAEHSALSDQSAITEDILRQKLGLALPPNVVERLMAMMTDTVEWTAVGAGVLDANKLDAKTFAQDDRIREVLYKEVPFGEQKLTFRGVLSDVQKTALKTLYNTLPAPQKTLFAELLEGVQQAARTFFETQLKKQQVRLNDDRGFLQDSDYQTLFAPLTPLVKIQPGDNQAAIDAKNLGNIAIEQENQKLLQQRRARLAVAFLPYLQQRLIHQFIVQTMTTAAGADPALVESLLTDARLLTSADTTPLLNAFAEIDTRGLTATYWFSADQTGVSLTTLLRADDLLASAGQVGTPVRAIGAKRAEIVGMLTVPTDGDYQFSVLLARNGDKVTLSLGDPLTVVINQTANADGQEFTTADIALVKETSIPIYLVVEGVGARQVRLSASGPGLAKATHNSVRLAGSLEVPAPGAYRVYIELAKQNASAKLHFDHLPNPLFLDGTADVPDKILGQEAGKFLELKTGVLYPFTVDLKQSGGGGARLLAQGEMLPKASLAQLTLYPLASSLAAERAALLLTKTLQIVSSLGLSEREIRYLLMNAAAFDDLNLSLLPTQPPPTSDNADVNANARDLWKPMLRLFAYTRLKREIAAGTNDLITLFEANGTDDLDKVYALIAKLTRREESTVRETANALFKPPKFASEKPLLQLWQALQVVERFGVPVAALLEWTRIVNPNTTADQRFEIARDLKEAIKARFTPETWQQVAQPIFDKLRQHQRDALVAYIMHQHGFESMEQLYEYFLIDPGMEPVVQTSRIRLAIGSLQLFIQRSLLNLEPRVHPATINSKHWEWMKRYRVWEANRKIFLFPENWLEPEFRDDKTHLFTELEGVLLQDDVSSDLVEDAFLSYLKKLDELARLDIVGMHIEDNADPARRILHVFGRTYSQPHKYFYRRYAHRMWTPWEPVSAEIEGDHLVPVIWRNRLYLFWLTFLEKAKFVSKPVEVDFVTPVTIQGEVPREVEVYLHWSEYLQGEWSTRESGSLTPPEDEKIKADISSYFHASKVFVHVSKKYDTDGTELGVSIHMSSPINKSFYLAGRNSSPVSDSYQAPPDNPYSASDIKANRYAGSGALSVTLRQRITNELVANQIPLYRLVNTKNGDHFYTVSAQERDNAVQAFDYIFEGIACYVLPAYDRVGVPLYRMLHANNGDHFYTISEAERDRLIQSRAYTSEGAACNVLPVGEQGASPLYRLWLRKTGDHFYTMSALERDRAIKNGYTNEGIACHIVLQEEQVSPQIILNAGGRYTLLPCDNTLIAPSVTEEMFRDAGDPGAVADSVSRGVNEIMTLTKPVFYQDHQYTLFLEPNVVETTVEEWQEWVKQTPKPEPERVRPGRPSLKEIVVIPDLPLRHRIPVGDPAPIDRLSLAGQPSLDWFVNPATLMLFDGMLIGSGGQYGALTQPTQIAGEVKAGGTPVQINSGSRQGAGGVVFADVNIQERDTLQRAVSGVNVIGADGFNTVHQENLNQVMNQGLNLNLDGFGSMGMR
jgi:hypothetical protein